MIVVHRPWLNRLSVLIVGILTLGFVWIPPFFQIKLIDHPRIRRLPTIGRIKRWRMTLRARRQGKRDGKLGIPRLQDELAPPEVWKLKQQGDETVRGITATWVATDARLTGEHAAIERAVTAEDERSQRVSTELKELKSRCDTRRKRLDQMKSAAEKAHPEEQWRIPTWFYVLALTIIFIGEFPLNAVAFNLFGENRWPTYAMTAGLAAVLVFCAHGLGILWRQRSMSDRDMIVTGLLFILPVAVIVAIAIVREEYLQALNRTGGGLAVLSPGAGIMIFIVMNLIIYLAAFALSYLHHDPTGELVERVEREVRRGDRRVRRRRRKLERAASMKQWLLTKVALWEGAQDEAHRNTAFQAKRHKDFFEALMQEYWAANRRVTERAFRKRAAQARRRGEKMPTDADLWKPPKALAEPPEIAQDLWQDGAFDAALMERLFAARDGRKARPAPKRPRRKASAGTSTAEPPEPVEAPPRIPRAS